MILQKLVMVLVVVCALGGLCQSAQATYCTKYPPAIRTGFLGLDLKDTDTQVWVIKDTKSVSIPTRQMPAKSRQITDGLSVIKIKF